MALDIDDFTELQKLREATRAKSDPSYTPGIIPLTEVAEIHNVSIRTLINAYQVSGLRGIDDYSLLTPAQATSAASALQRYKELKDPELSRLRRNGHVPIREFANDVQEPLETILDFYAAIGFPQDLLNETLWLFPTEQRNIRSRIETRNATPVSLPPPTATISAESVSTPAPGPTNVHETDSVPTPAPTEEAGTIVSAKKVELAVKHKIYESTIEPPLIDLYGNKHQDLLSDRTVATVSSGQTIEGLRGSDAAVIHELQKTLNTFSSASYGVFFHQMREALKIDERIQRSIPSKRTNGSPWTNLTHAKFIHEVCSYSYGIFAYKNLGSKLGDRAYSKKLPQPHIQKNSLHKFRPMHRGLLTDESHRQFILWRVGKGSPDFRVIKWTAVDDWLKGLVSGSYVGLRTRYISTSTMPDVHDQLIIKLMIEMADDLRRGVHRTVQQKTESSSVSRSFLAGTRSSDSRQLRYKAQDAWLVPITVSGRQAVAGLDEGFFEAHGGQRAHKVRSFYRRAPGSSRNAPKDILVQGHTRGGYHFEDAKLLPAVTITRPRHA